MAATPFCAVKAAGGARPGGGLVLSGRDQAFGVGLDHALGTAVLSVLMFSPAFDLDPKRNVVRSHQCFRCLET